VISNGKVYSKDQDEQEGSKSLEPDSKENLGLPKPNNKKT
jgi:hypothetical protein